MEDNFNHDEFEEFLQDQVRNHRMYPSDAVWREIDKKLHGERRWPALTLAALVLLSATVLICVYFTPKPSIFSTIKPANATTSTHPSSSKNSLLDNIAPATPFLEKNSVYVKPLSVAALKFAATKAMETIQENTSPQLTQINTTANVSSSPGSVITEAIAGEKNGKENLSTVLNNTKDVTPKKQKPAAEASSTKDYNDKNMVDEFLKEQKADVALHTAPNKTSVKNKWSYQIYAAPSVSFRKLLEDNSLEKGNTAGPVALNYVTDVNKVVRHKPGTGIEIGVSFMYNLSNKVRAKAGFQFNLRQYSIEAYRSNTELASIALRENNRIDTINTISFYRNNNGYSSAELVNRYYQVSMPLGLEWEVVGNKRIQLNIAGTIQPTYQLNRNAFLLSTNFKNYTENPGMVRQWNINSNIEAFISYKVGDFKWQLGPQLRYQPYSTFIPQYPIKEHLMDYGIKLGVSKTIN